MMVNNKSSENNDNLSKNKAENSDSEISNLTSLTNIIIVESSSEDDEAELPFCTSLKITFNSLSLIKKIAVIILGLILLALFTVLIWWACGWHIAVIFPSIMVLFFSCFSVYTIQCTKMWRKRRVTNERDALERVRNYHIRKSANSK